MRRNGNLGNLAQNAAAGEMAMQLPQDPAQRMQAQINWLMQRAQAEEARAQRVPPGALVEYYGDLSSGVLAPEDMRVEDFRFRVQINPAGQVTFATEPIQVISRYNFAFRRVLAYAMSPGFVGAGPALLTFNIQEAGRNFVLFKNPISMASLLATGGAGNVAEWDGVYITVPGTQLEVTWQVDTRWAALVGATQEYGIQLLGDNVVCRPA